MRRLRPILGLVLAAYGVLVLGRVLAHEAPVAGAVSLGLGVILLSMGAMSAPIARGRWVCALGLGLVLVVLGYNLIRSSGLSAPEWSLVLYGACLAASSVFLDRRVGPWTVGSLVAWSFPLVLAPLSMFALNATLSSPSAGAAASPVVHWLIVLPSVLMLRAIGLEATLYGGSVIVPVARGSLSLDIGLVCAGLYPMVLFGALLGLHAWREGMPRLRALRLLGVGLLGLWFVNLLRLVALTLVGVRWGAGALQAAHAHLGWLLFAAYVAGFWAVAMRSTSEPVFRALRTPAMITHR